MVLCTLCKVERGPQSTKLPCYWRFGMSLHHCCCRRHRCLRCLRAVRLFSRLHMRAGFTCVLMHAASCCPEDSARKVLKAGHQNMSPVLHTRIGHIFTYGCHCRHVPTHVKQLGKVRMRQVSCGWRHSAAITTDGSVYTFGWSKYGQLGHGTYE